MTLDLKIPLCNWLWSGSVLSYLCLYLLRVYFRFWVGFLYKYCKFETIYWCIYVYIRMHKEVYIDTFVSVYVSVCMYVCMCVYMRFMYFLFLKNNPLNSPCPFCSLYHRHLFITAIISISASPFPLLLLLFPATLYQLLSQLISSASDYLPFPFHQSRLCLSAARRIANRLANGDRVCAR